MASTTIIIKKVTMVASSRTAHLLDHASFNERVLEIPIKL